MLQKLFPFELLVCKGVVGGGVMQLRDRLCKGLQNAGMARPTSGGKSSSAHHDRYNRMVCNEK